ncbi:ATP-binding protein [Rhizobium sp. S96]|uniref:HAMP domain-containing sensor histidine kinase n=1 Tax=Rhizobium sp. S96 TaxID=3055140 RepID=UPI0025AA71DF|nr:ATP-binding protein [Rhizobium sp. S96]MDM9618860.1 ATP-binding protein [Rhizobium sp. S96]
MPRANLLRSTPFRLALTFGLLFIAAFFVAGVITYRTLERGLTRQLDESVNATYLAVASTFSQNDAEDLIAAVNTYASLHGAGRGVFSLADASGKRLAGNLAPPALSEGLWDVDSDDLGLPGNKKYRARVGIVGGNRLVVGQSFSERDRLANILLISLGWSAGLIVVIAFAGAMFVAARAQGRLDAVARTMEDVSNGQLATRIRLKGNGDDIDRVSEHINHALDRLSGLVDGMRQVSADIAHELKTPLNRLKMTLEDAADKDERGQPVASLLAEARAESDQINATFEALLRISQLEAGTRRTRFQPVDLVDVMSSVAEIYADVAEDEGHSLQFSGPDARSAMVMGDRELLTQLFVNLIENAINHCPPGTAIQLGLEIEGGAALATVTDSGPGIPAHEREKVFRRLYRLDKSRTTPGSGLGLSLVRAISDLHFAELSLEDNRPGVRVALLLPLSD